MNDDARAFVGEILVSEEDLQRKVTEIAARISADYGGRELLVIGGEFEVQVLSGG